MAQRIRQRRLAAVTGVLEAYELAGCIEGVSVTEIAEQVLQALGHPRKRLGSLEQHLVDVMSQFGLVADMDAFVQKAVDTLPAPQSGKRDTRKQQVVRALYVFNKKQNVPLRLEGETVVVCS